MYQYIDKWQREERMLRKKFKAGYIYPKIYHGRKVKCSVEGVSYLKSEIKSGK
jgi:hypothetical protein